MIKGHQKLLKTVSAIFLIQLIFSAFLFLSSSPVLAQTPTQNESELTNSINFKPQISIPNSEFNSGVSVPVGTYNSATGKMESDLLGRYLLSIINYALAAVAIVATVVLMGGGLLWLTSRGDSGQISKAKGLIGGSLTGMILLLCSWIILNTINPELTKFQSIDTKLLKTKAYNVLSCCHPEKGLIETRVEIKNGKKIALEGENKGKEVSCPGGIQPECNSPQVCVKYGKANLFACVDDLVCCQCSWQTAGLQNNVCQYNHTVESCRKYCGERDSILRGQIYYDTYSMKTHSCGSILLLQADKCVYK